MWGCSSHGRALALHARGTGFDTPHLHFFSCNSSANVNQFNGHDECLFDHTDTVNQLTFFKFSSQ
ncbi:hypothetical protein MTR_8g105280 [Medicago truncatula]|uniref:Uncharacterized protein n=1 Tax=Medicago truncatula TaxID=3880 RepID=G7LAL1_MEDTR|nr:hypothetical protein MTR_8g105280 [Medicago truncatula]